MYSFWEKQFWSKKFDFLIIGAGFTGLNVALNLKKRYPKSQVLVIDKIVRFSMASTKNAGFACFGSPSELISDIDKIGESEALRLLNLRFDGIAKIKREFGTCCQYEETDAFEWLVSNELLNKCVGELDYLNHLIGDLNGGFSTYEALLNEEAINTINGIIKIRGEGQLNPKMLHESLLKRAIRHGIEVLDQTAAIALDNDKVFTQNGLSLQSEIIINCTNALSGKLFKNKPVKPARAQVLITSEIENLPYHGNFHMDEGFYYFRNVGKRLLLGGARNADFEGEGTSELGLNPKIKKKLDSLLKQLLPKHEFEIEQRWSGIMGFTDSKVPIIANNGNQLHVVGMNGMGVAISFSISRELASEF
ncbi:MAG: NAD(P)/FAD-dependent oxidoreductase [Bacteroidia bacterium]